MGSVCDFDFACVDGVCTPPGDQGLLYFFCNVGGAPCTTGLYCRPYEETYPRPDIEVSLNYDGQCVAPRLEGSRCDGNWALLGAGRLCDPGLECVLDPRSQTGERACFRACNDVMDSTDCPCPSGERVVLPECIVNTPEIPAGAGGICATCIQSHETCEAGGWTCCDGDDTCNSGRCCHANGTNCATNDDCCGGSACGTDGACHGCPSAGDAPDVLVGCCALELRGGVCAVPCDDHPDPMCDPPECRTNPGRWTCTVKGSVCEPTRSSESCDGIDNDCNGRTDDIPSTACMGPVPPSADGVFQGCPSLMLPGMTACTGGTSRCEVTRGYCAWDSIGNAIDRAPPTSL